MNPNKQTEREMYREALSHVKEIESEYLNAKTRYKEIEDNASKKRTEAFAAADQTLREKQRVLALEYRQACDAADREFDNNPDRLAALNEVNEKHVVFRNAWNAFCKLDGEINGY